MFDEAVEEEIEIIMEMIEYYGALRHVGGYKKGKSSCTQDKSEYKKYLDMFDRASNMSDLIESRIKKLVDKSND
jgi:hypothetical protein